MSTNFWFFGVGEPALSAHRAAHGPIDVEDVLEVDIDGLTELGANFRGAWLFFDDLQQRMPAVAGTDWVNALADGTGRLPAAVRGVPALQDLAEQELVILTGQEFAQLVAAALAAVAADPGWSEDGAANGPTWWYLANEGAKHAGDLIAVVAL